MFFGALLPDAFRCQDLMFLCTQFEWEVSYAHAHTSKAGGDRNFRNVVAKTRRITEITQSAEALRTISTTGYREYSSTVTRKYSLAGREPQISTDTFSQGPLGSSDMLSGSVAAYACLCLLGKEISWKLLHLQLCPCWETQLYNM